ncbi:MAG: PH domain-containing protein [Candidatus Nanopelagicales bacterium]
MTDKRKVHPITPVVRVATYLPAIVVFFLLSAGSSLLKEPGGPIVLVVGLVLLVGVTLGYEYLAYRRLAFWFDDDGDLRVQKGVVFQQERRLQLSRLQTVDINRPLVARVFGYAALRIEVAGAGDSRADLQYLTDHDAEALRSEILARSAGLSHDVGEAPEQSLLVVPVKDLFLSLLLRAATVFLVLATALIVVSTVWASGWTGLFTVFLGGVPLFMIFTEFTQLYNFTVAQSPDGLRLRHGLLQTQARTIPPGRVCAVEFVEPLLWRRRGWVRLYVTVAGLTKSDDEAGTESVLLPVAPREVADMLFQQVMPGAAPNAVEMAAPVGRVQRRSPVQWRQLRAGADARIAVLTRGRVTRRRQVVDHARVQSVRVTQGPWERPLGLASVHLDLPPGRITATWLHFGVDQAHALAAAELAHMRAARAADRSTRWMREE